jgi:serine/threonine protein kinase
VHRDLKPDNVLFKTRPEVSKRIAVIDFGYCEMAEVPNKPQMFYNVGSPKYMAPEAYVDNLYSEKSDMWALGVILYEMLVGRTCDQGLKMEVYLEMIRKGGIPLPAHLSPFAKHILTKMLAYSHQARSDCLQVLK